MQQCRPDAKGGSGMTQFGRALAELNIEIICANSSRAKGRVERANRTLQDRLVKELRLEKVCGMVAGNEFLPKFMTRFNERFAVQALRPENLHRSLNVASLSCVQQRPTCEPHRHRREQATRSRTVLDQGTTGREARAEGADQ